MTTPFERTRDLLVDEVLLLLASQGLEARPVDESAPPTECVLASIGFGGVDLRGAIVVLASTDAWRLSAQKLMGEKDPSEAILCDLAGEFCNLLSGHFRNRLLRLGVDVRCGIPTSAYGALALPKLPANRALHIVQRSFQSAAGIVTLRADFLFRDDFVFPEESTSRVEPNTAAVLLF